MDGNSSELNNKVVMLTDFIKDGIPADLFKLIFRWREMPSVHHGINICLVSTLNNEALIQEVLTRPTESNYTYEIIRNHFEDAELLMDDITVTVPLTCPVGIFNNSLCMSLIFLV